MSLRFAVIGVGHLGQHHARILSDMRGVTLAGVVDTKTERARTIGEQYGVPSYTDARDVLDKVDAVTIATPTTLHVDVALPFVERGIPVLVEKPIAASVHETDRLLAAAARQGTTVATGHTERFNPAVTAARPLIRGPRFIEGHRLGVFPERSLDIDVVFDLMIHDLDLVLALVDSPVESVEAVGVAVLTPRTDIANARIRFASGCIANLTASRISRDRVRRIRFFQADAYISVDYAARELEVYRLADAASTDASPGLHGARPAIVGGKVECGKEEPLRIELEDFAAAIRDNRPPVVSGRAGRDALALASTIVEQMQQGT